MYGPRIERWFAWGALVGVVVGLVVFTGLLFRREPAAAGPVTAVVGGRGWPRTLVERLPDGREHRRLILSSPPQRIVSVTLATDEILVDLVDHDRIAALSDFARQPGSLIADRIGTVEHFVSTDVESIVSLSPDLCFLASYNRQETRSLLIDSGIPVFIFHRFQSLDDIRDNLRMVGQAVGAESAAEGLIADMDRKLADVAKRLPPKTEWPAVMAYVESGWTPCVGTLQQEVFQAAGLRNAAAEHGITGFAQVSEEQVLEIDPDYLVVAVRSGGTAQQKDWFLNNPALATLRAIREDRFLTIREPQLSSVSHHLADAVVELARQTYPDEFPDDQQ